MKAIVSFLFLPLLAAQAQQRIVVVGTSLAETVYALGAGGALVATDNSSHEYIPETKRLPAIGAFRTVNAEGVLSLKPDLFLATVDAGPPEAVLQIRAAGVKTVVVPRNYKLDEVRRSIRQVAGLLHREARGEELVRSMDRQIQEARSMQAGAKAKPRVIFCGLGANMPGGSISGKNTRISEMIELAGGVNPITQFEGFRPLTEEGVVAAAPDIVLMTERSFERAGGLPGVLRLPGVALTPAGRSGRVVAVSDMYFQGFGPGIGKAVKELTNKLLWNKLP